MSKNDTKHLTILSASELSSLYNQPHLKPSEQVEYFSLPPDARTVMESTIQKNSLAWKDGKVHGDR